MENTSIILTDLDGTLFHDDKSVSERTSRAIRSAQEKGILVGVSTSRALVNVNGLLGDFNPDFIISNGGGLVTVKGEKIYSCEFTVEETQKILAKIYEVCGEDSEITVDTATQLFWNRTEENRSGTVGRSAEYDDMRNFREKTMKICVKTQDTAKAHEIASCIGPEKIDMLPFSDIPWYKFSKKDATKESAILALSAHLGIPVSRMAAFGDDFNDIGMLKLCGRGVAMENAIPQVKEVADETTLSNEKDGVAFWIEKNILQRDVPSS